MNGELPKAADIVETICATAYTDGKTDGVYAAALDVLAQRLQISRQALNKALAAGIGRGWLRLGKDQIELTAAGIYIAKLALKLPT
jgi:transcription initiation factor TFIIIB Brf1 subunit/transcription initiation factor TFIIB